MNIYNHWTVNNEEEYKVGYDNEDKIIYEFSDMSIKIIALGYGDK